MSDTYIYTTPEARSIRIGESVNEDDAVHVSVSSGSGLHVGLDIPDAQRRHAAQALVGDGYEVAAKLADWERDLLEKQSTIDPADVKVGDVVEVEAADESWLVRGAVVEKDPSSRDMYAVRVGPDRVVWYHSTAPFTDAAVRLVRRAEPEPDPEQVEALHDLICAVRPDEETLTAMPLARALARRGVTVQKET